jgi:hypothetical protein
MCRCDEFQSCPECNFAHDWPDGWLEEELEATAAEIALLPPEIQQWFNS